MSRWPEGLAGEPTYEGAAVTVADLREAMPNMGLLLVAENGRALALDGPAAAGAKHQVRRRRSAPKGKAGECCG
jgi:hypothetical protein